MRSRRSDALLELKGMEDGETFKWQGKVRTDLVETESSPMHDVPVDFKSKSMVGLAPQDREQDTEADGVMEEVVYQQHRMAAGNIFRRAPDCLPMGTEIPLRSISESPQSWSLYLVRKKGKAVSTGATEKSMLSHGLLDPIEPWRLGSEILPKRVTDCPCQLANIVISKVATTSAKFNRKIYQWYDGIVTTIPRESESTSASGGTARLYS